MIGEEAVATSAALHSAAVGSGFDDVDLALTLNRLATLGGGLVRAINLSTHRALGFFEEPNGSSHIASFVDWSARQHDVLYAIAWANEDQSQPSTPVDNLNGITVAASEKPMGTGAFRKFGSTNNLDGLEFEDTMNIQLLAPGHDVVARGFNNVAITNTGTSFAVPHVTGAAALLHEHSNDHFGGIPNSRRHEVIKAVMMNSADKIAGIQGSNRTVLDSNDMDWTQSEAYLNSSIPLDDQMGAGHLNVRRALQQYSPGEQNPGTVQLLGWDYGSYGSDGQQAVYTLNGSVSAGQYITVTLVWDRDVQSTGGTTYGAGDTFFGSGVADLNLAIERTNGTILRTSISEVTNYEHIFYQTGVSEDIRIIVSRLCCAGPASGNYAIAWWAGNAASVPGDYNKNGSVGPEDYDVWKANFGTSFADADGNGNGTVDAADYTIWRNNFGAGVGSGGLARVPEPTTALLAVAGLILGLNTKRSARRFN
jgi:hypothetical protein